MPPGAVIEDVPAKEVTLVLQVAGTVEQFADVKLSVEANLRQELQCFLPACLLTVTATAGSVILTIVVTDTTATTPGETSPVVTAAVAMTAMPLDGMSSALGVTITEAPAAPSVANVQVSVLRLAPSPPPPSPPPASPSPCTVLADCEATCVTNFETCNSNGGTGCKKTKKQCKKDCAAAPNLCPPCEDNTISGFGTFWCDLNKRADAGFCAGSHAESKCKKTCGLCR